MMEFSDCVSKQCGVLLFPWQVVEELVAMFNMVEAASELQFLPSLNIYL